MNQDCWKDNETTATRNAFADPQWS